MLKIGDSGIDSVYLGAQKIVRAYLGESIVFDSAGPPVRTFRVSVSADPAGGGTVSGSGTYQMGESVTVTASAGDGYEFSGWMENGAVVSESASYTFTVSGDRELVAAFAVKEASGLPGGYTVCGRLRDGRRQRSSAYRLGGPGRDPAGRELRRPVQTAHPQPVRAAAC